MDNVNVVYTYGIVNILWMYFVVWRLNLV